MKRYEKPRLSVERFEMTQAIAGDCDAIYKGANDDRSCKVEWKEPDNGMQFYFNAASECGLDISGAPNEIYCYQNSTGAAYVGINS